MRWAKLGVILPAPPPLSWACSHAALPTIETRDDAGADMLFSARDARGRSHIARARLTLGHEPGAQVEHGSPLLEPGSLGSFDDSGVTSSCVVEHSGKRFLYYTGWSLGRTVPFYLFAGCAIAEPGDGTYRRISAAPLLDRSDTDAYLTASPWVLVEGDTWRMWYVSADGWQETANGPRHRYHIRYAESRDGISWMRTGRVCIDFKDETEYAISRPCVVRDADRYRMWFAARGTAYRIGYAESDDGLLWRRDDAQSGFEPSTSEWDSTMQAYPVVLDHSGRRYMLYNGNGFGATGIGLAILASV